MPQCSRRVFQLFVTVQPTAPEAARPGGSALLRAQELCETDDVPELPEVQGLAQALGAQCAGRSIRAVHVVSFPALKTYDPPVTALHGRTVTGVHRHGKWIDVVTAANADGSSARGDRRADPAAAASTDDDDELHLVFHLARGGWVRWQDEAPTRAPRPGRSGLAARVALDVGAFDLIEAGTTKRLAIHVVRRASDVERIATLGVDPLSTEFTRAVLDDLLDARNAQIKGLLRDQSLIAGIGNAYSDEILHAARLSPFALSRSLDASARDRLVTSIQEVLTAAVRASADKETSELKDVKRAGMSVHGRT